MAGPRQTHRYSVSEWVNVAWDLEGKSVTLNFLADDQTALALAMPPDLLEALRQDIAYALARRP